MSDSDYEVGYGKPPKHTQFKKGQCANPRGRGARKDGSFLEDDAFRKLLNGKIVYTTQGKSRTTTRLKLLVKKHIALAVKGDVTSAVSLIKMRALFTSVSTENVDWITFTNGIGPMPGEHWIKVSDS